MATAKAREAIWYGLRRCLKKVRVKVDSEKKKKECDPLKGQSSLAVLGFYDYVLTCD